MTSFRYLSKRDTTWKTANRTKEKEQVEDKDPTGPTKDQTRKKKCENKKRCLK